MFGRHRRHPDCNKKTPYGKDEALDLAYKLRQEGNDVLATPCGCGGWHLHGRVVNPINQPS